MEKLGTDLQDCAAPDDVGVVLQNAAQAFLESRHELAAAWQDPHAGKVWEGIAKALSACAVRCDGIARRGTGR